MKDSELLEKLSKCFEFVNDGDDLRDRGVFYVKDSWRYSVNDLVGEDVEEEMIDRFFNPLKESERKVNFMTSILLRVIKHAEAHELHGIDVVAIKEYLSTGIVPENMFFDDVLDNESE